MPGVVDAGTPDHVIALPFERDAANGEVKPELAPYKQDHCGALITA